MEGGRCKVFIGLRMEVMFRGAIGGFAVEERERVPLGEGGGIMEVKLVKGCVGLGRDNGVGVARGVDGKITGKVGETEDSGLEGVVSTGGGIDESAREEPGWKDVGGGGILTVWMGC